VGALIRIKNEDFWIELILRTTCKALDEVVVVDTGSTDGTLGIIGRLKEEGLGIRLIEHGERAALFNVAANAVLDRGMTSEFFYLVDGDEIQLGPSLERLKETVGGPDAGGGIWRIAAHQLHVHPDDFLRCTKPYAEGVRFRPGRAFSRRELRLSEIMVNDGIQRRNGLPFLEQEAHSLFVAEAYELHCPFTRRSTIASWQGNAEVNRAYAGEYRMKRYQAAEAMYERLPFFPKEVLECRYSGHNPYLGQVLEAGIPLV
jgi:glycosyltransferase involved in cell wall biosynthesis